MRQNLIRLRGEEKRFLIGHAGEKGSLAGTTVFLFNTIFHGQRRLALVLVERATEYMQYTILYLP